jgi:DNA invertase Pin-like site-specific DNA recombinase
MAHRVDSRQRPAFDAPCRAATRRDFDVVMVWSVDRLGRSLQDLVAFLSELHALGIDLFLHQQGLDTTTPAGKAMFQMMGVFAEFERAMIQERVRAGLAVRARPFGLSVLTRLKPIERDARPSGSWGIGRLSGFGSSWPGAASI